MCVGVQNCFLRQCTSLHPRYTCAHNVYVTLETTENKNETNEQTWYFGIQFYFSVRKDDILFYKCNFQLKHSRLLWN
jgi:hypothetical protein